MEPGDRLVMVISQTSSLLLTVSLNYKINLYFEISSGVSSMDFREVRISGSMDITLTDIVESGRS